MAAARCLSSSQQQWPFVRGPTDVRTVARGAALAAGPSRGSWRALLPRRSARSASAAASHATAPTAVGSPHEARAAALASVAAALLVGLAAPAWPAAAADVPQACPPDAPAAAAVAASRLPLASLFGGEEEDIRDPIGPFTLGGTTNKKFLIEELSGEKIIGRRRGFTVDACVGVVEEPMATLTERATKELKDKVCNKSEGAELKSTCRSACEAACDASLAAYSDRVTRESGFKLLAGDKARLAKSCARECTYECGKPGAQFSFSVLYRR